MVNNATKILYTGSFRFPEKDAAAVRVRLIAECLRSYGCEVEFLSWGEGCHREQYEFQGFKYRCMNEFRYRKVNVFVRVFNFLFLGRKSFFWLLHNRKFLKNIDCLIVYNPPSIFSLLVFMLSKIYKFNVVLDSSEWYESEHLIGGRFGLASLENWLRMKVIYRLFKNVIAISKFLDRYYTENFGARTVHVPAMCERTSVGLGQCGSADIVNLLYAGNAGKKDRLQDVIRCLPYWNKISSKEVFLHVYGVEYKDFEKIISSEELFEVKDFLIIHGKVRRSDIISAYTSANFSILFRERKRYALAGFPTKAVESWASGVPLLTNAIGDLNEFCNKDNSVVLDINHIKDGFLHFLEEYDTFCARKLQAGSLDTAHKEFSIEANSEKIFEFIKSIER